MMTNSNTVEIISDKRIEQLFNEHYSILTVYANKFLKNLEESREVVQDVFVKLYDRKERISIHTSVKSHLYQSVKNACLNIIKQNQNRSLHHENILYLSNAASYEIDDVFEQTELEYQLYKAISELPEQCQRIFRMNRIEGLDNQEIADYLQISKRTVETQISKALKSLRLKLSPTLLHLMILWLIYNTN
ncbi:RNA polymerase sigma-70 factor (ECF subfamily) [Ancylomarina subtilis]|uniref:RNA polymerase sigma-70 factor (ECF subfamily) n=1 Tax=Ancylomarina subtilis TaxID=1639035 RepID=A0A4V2FSW7_9BACT|nr:RNA polymerase sigma-70 factor [Ancylomarina subtilis]RZT95855.1 RNA polymerase sigma-70 factor (ECF subfamily) [Ancylomarina subtilis]